MTTTHLRAACETLCESGLGDTAWPALEMDTRDTLLRAWMRDTGTVDALMEALESASAERTLDRALAGDQFSPIGIAVIQACMRRHQKHVAIAWDIHREGYQERREEYAATDDACQDHGNSPCDECWTPDRPGAVL